MLAQFRTLAQSKIGIPIIGLMILGMAAWGIEDIFSGGFGRKVIKVGDRSATETQINRRLETYMNNLRLENPRNAISRQQAASNGLLDSIFTQEIGRLTRLGYARTLGADASGTALLADVNNIDQFKNPLTNEFDSQYYRNALLRAETTPTEFEIDTQDRLTQQYLQEGITSALVAPIDLARIQAIHDGEVRYISWFSLKKADVPPIGDPTDEELLAFFEENKAAFEAPERRQLTLLDLSGQDFLHQIEITDEIVQDYYERSKFRRLAVDEERTFNEYIFQTEEAAKAAFGVLAIGGAYDADPNVQTTLRRSSDDAVAIEEIRVPIFSPGAEPGTIAGPVAANGGWIVAQLVEVHPGVPLSLEETREEIIEEIKAERAELEYYAAINEEIDDLIAQGQSLELIATAFGTPVLTFAPVDQTGRDENGIPLSALFTMPEAFRQAFEISVDEKTDKFSQDDRTVMISVDKIIPKSIPPFEEIEDRVRVAYQLSKEGEALRRAADSIQALVDSGAGTLASQAERYGSEVQTRERGLRRTALDRTVPQSVANAAFTLQEGKSTVTQGTTPDELIIAQLDLIERPQPNELDVLAPISAPRITDQLTQDLIFAFEKEVESAMDVEVLEGDYLAYRQRLIDDQ